MFNIQFCQLLIYIYIFIYMYTYIIISTLAGRLGSSYEQNHPSWLEIQSMLTMRCRIDSSELKPSVEESLPLEEHKWGLRWWYIVTYRDAKACWWSKVPHQDLCEFCENYLALSSTIFCDGYIYIHKYLYLYLLSRNKQINRCHIYIYVYM